VHIDIEIDIKQIFFIPKTSESNSIIILPLI